MMKRPAEAGVVLVDLVVGLVFFGFVLGAVYQLFVHAFAFSHTTDEQLAAQQDLRLAIDRVARQLHETTLTVGRVRVYTAQAGCTDEYQACIGFVTARGSDCLGPFQLQNGVPDWLATIYVWRDTSTDELRSRCDSSTGFPAGRWPPPLLTPYTLIGTHIIGASFMLLPSGSPAPTAVAVEFEEDLVKTARPVPADEDTSVNQTIFVPANR